MILRVVQFWSNFVTVRWILDPLSRQKSAPECSHLIRLIAGSPMMFLGARQCQFLLDVSHVTGQVTTNNGYNGL